MNIILREIRSGSKCRLLAMGTRDECPVYGFLTDIEKNQPNEASKILALLQHTADAGPPRNKEKCRFFKDIKVFEFKTNGGMRIMSFWDADNLIICSHGFLKKSQKTPKREKERAKQARDAYFAAKEKNMIICE